MNTTYFYHDKPLFGLDIGFSTIKVMQINQLNKKEVVNGYGVINFPPEAIKDGVVIDAEAIAKAAHELFSHRLIGEINTRRVAVAIPAARTFTRSMTLPTLPEKELAEAVQAEAEQYIPMPLEDLYMDYGTASKTDKDTDLLAVAAPKKVVDSYMDLMEILGLDPVTFETTISAAGRLFVHSEQSDVPTVLIDFGSMSADITIFDRTLIVTGTVPCGGDVFTNLIAESLKVTKQEAHIIKTKYGLGFSKKQAEIQRALDPVLEQLLKEVRRVIRYYEERFGSKDKKKQISQIVTMGGGANMPGLSDYMTNILRLPVRMCDPWQHLSFSGLQPPSTIEKSMYVTVTGLALLEPKEVYR